jgi:Tol biopolymer transport system component/DNA-binding winged helix-turn-helix (wHTH) protein
LIGDFQLADWQVQPQLNCVRRGEKSIHVEPKVMQVLVQLADHPDEVLSKEQLMHAVWSDTFVGDEVLTRCISEIRRALEDDARAPRFVQTIPKVGYRLIAPVDRRDLLADSRATKPTAARLPDERSEPPAPAMETPAAAPSPSTIVSPGLGPVMALRWAVIAFVALAVLAVGTWILRSRRPLQTGTGDYRTLPFTSYSGSQTQPAFSPDGNKIAFVWNGENGGRQSVYVKVIGTENPVRLTSGPGDDYSPVWSPDGRFLAFLRSAENGQGLYIIPSIGGPERKVASRSGVADNSSRMSVTWSPDGKQLVFTDGKSTQSPSSLFSLNLETLAVQRITTPAPSWDGDYSPVFSPDGKRIAFIRDVEASLRDVYILPADGGEPTRLTSDNRQVSGLAWSSDGTSVIFSSDRRGKFALWRVAASGGAPERLPVGTEGASYPAIAPKGDRLAYAQTSAQWSIMRVVLDTAGKAKTTRLLSSTEQDSAPRYSPDGTRIAFQSWRSGTQEIWVCASSGSGPVQLTSFNGPLTGSPSWSPDGQQIAFDSRPEGRSHIYVVSVDGGVPQKVTSGDQNDILPTWSRDMKSIYFASNRSGAWDIWKVPANGGEARRMTRRGGFMGIESFDSKWLYYTKADLSGLWRIPANGDKEEQLLNQPKSGYWGYWSVAKDGIYYLNDSNAPPSIDFFDPLTKRARHVHILDHMPPVYNGLSVAGDGRSLLYTEATDAGSHITLVEHFR